MRLVLILLSATAALLTVPGAHADALDDALRAAADGASQALVGAGGAAVGAVGTAHAAADQAVADGSSAAQGAVVGAEEEVARAVGEAAGAAVDAIEVAVHAPDEAVALLNHKYDQAEALLPYASDYFTSTTRRVEDLDRPILLDFAETYDPYFKAFNGLLLISIGPDGLYLGATDWTPPDPEAFAHDTHGFAERSAATAEAWTLATAADAAAFGEGAVAILLA